MTKSKANDHNDFDIFIANKIYPDAQILFSVRPLSLDSIKNDSLVVVDTNVLLLPYNIGRESLEKIDETFNLLVQTNQLIVPGQVAREFAKNRAAKLGTLFQQIARKREVKFIHNLLCQHGMRHSDFRN